MDHRVYDLVVIGGGINGAGIARDAAGRGLHVLLCEKNDLASGTSSASTKLIHGGLRYLEHGDFRLIKEALHEQEILRGIAPHIIWPLRFILPYAQGMRPYWMLRAGLCLYDILGWQRRLPHSEKIRFEGEEDGAILRHEFVKGFAYMDCWVQDARLVVLNAMDAALRGASIHTRTECKNATRNKDGLWNIKLHDTYKDCAYHVRAKALVNAAGPWAMKVAGHCGKKQYTQRLQLVKGSHIIVPRLFPHASAYILQQPDKRIVFAIPYEREFTLIGTTEVAHDPDDLRHITISREETFYLCDAVNRYFTCAVKPEQVVSSYAGVRPLVEEEGENISAISREYKLDIEAQEGKAPLLTVYGGKLTTYRKLAERAVDMLASYLPMQKEHWTADTPLPGGDLPEGFKPALAEWRKKYPWMPEVLLWRYARNYGTLMEEVLGDASSLGELGENFGGGLYEAELSYLYHREWVRMPEDVLWRRTKLGLTVPKGTETKILMWLATKKHRAIGG